MEGYRVEHRDHFGFVSPAEAARVLGVSECTLQRWRSEASGPGYVKIGGRVRYSYPMLLEYVDAQTCHVGQREVA
jgi:hypothetical protein